jgi:hypothetical protein
VAKSADSIQEQIFTHLKRRPGTGLGKGWTCSAVATGGS